MPLKPKWALHKVNSQLIMDFGFERIMMNHIASEMIAIIAQEQKMFENQMEQHPGNRLTKEFAGICIRRMQRIVNSKIDHGIFLETVQKRQGSPQYLLKITGDPYLETRLTPWKLNTTTDEYYEPNYYWQFDSLTNTGDYVWDEEEETA